MSYDPIISRNRNGSVDSRGNSRFGYLAGSHEPSTHQAKRDADRAALEASRRTEMAARLVRDGLDSGDEEKLSDGLLMKSRNVELADGASYIGHYGYHLTSGHLVRLSFKLTAMESCHVADMHAEMVGLPACGPEPTTVEVLPVRDAAQAVEVVQAMEMLGWLRRHIDDPAWADVGPLSELEDMFQPAGLPDA